MRKIFIAVLILFIGHYVAGQSQRFGVKAGANLFILSSSNDKTMDYSTGKVGYTIGGTYVVFLNKSFSIQPELNYSYQEAREEYYGSTIKVAYTQVPILARFHPANAKIALYAGPQVGFLGSAKIKEENGTETGVAGQLNQTDLGIAFGLATVPVNKNITFDLRVYRGLMNVFKSEFDGGITSRPTLITITVGYLFGK